MPNDGVTLRVKPWPRPAYSPYQKEQVIASVLLSLLFECHPSIEKPLELKVQIDDPAEEALCRFAGRYAINESGTQLTLGSLPGVNWERDRDGVMRVKFLQVKEPRREESPLAVLAVVPVIEGGGDCDETLVLIPAWEKDPSSALALTWSSMSRLKNAFSIKKGTNVNPVCDSPLESNGIQGDPAGGFSVTIRMPGEEKPETKRDLLLACWSMAITDALNEGRGVDVTCLFDDAKTSWPMFSSWKKDDVKLDSRFSQHLRFDLENGKLVEGDLGRWVIKPRETGGWNLEPDGAEDAEPVK